MESTRVLLPGFGLPLNHYQENGDPDALPNALNPLDMDNGRTVLELTTLREFTMLHIMNYITDKPDWRTKVFSDDIANSWKREALEMPGRDISRPMMDWVIDELRYKAKLHEDIGAVIVYTGHVVKSDTVVPESLKLELQAAVVELEDVPDKHKDWHPESNGKVLDLVHPSLYSLVYSRTRVLETGKTSLEDCIARCGEGKITEIPSEKETYVDSTPPYHYHSTMKNPYSRVFQWLPCMVDISGEHSKITSYINNLHPVKYKGLYGLIERVIDAAIPLWNLTLGPLVFNNWSEYLRIHYYRNYSDSIDQPEPDVFQPPEPDATLDIDLNAKYLKNGLQIIVKLANIHLTPENPSYEGGSWHVEGQLNEHICATALYYYSNENIETSNLAFRQQSSTQTAAQQEYGQDDHDWLPAIFGCEQRGPGLQVIGSVETREGRLLTFPNILQHRVEPFSLVDRKKPGHRKILALFLVDPNLPILSTANVPCQQMDWWRKCISELGTGLDRLPVELQDEVYKGITYAFPFSQDEAKDLRLELMGERKAFEIKQAEAFQGFEFSLCEH